MIDILKYGILFFLNSMQKKELKGKTIRNYHTKILIQELDLKDFVV